MTAVACGALPMVCGVAALVVFLLSEADADSIVECSADFVDHMLLQQTRQILQ